jgi:hypothetical protein
MHMKVRSPDNGVFTSEVYFSGEDHDVRRETDPVFQSRIDKEKLIVQRESRPPEAGMDIPVEEDAAHCNFDIMYKI